MSHHVDEGGAVFRAIHLDGDIVILYRVGWHWWNFPRVGVCTGPGNDWSAPGFPSDPYHERPPSPPGTCHLAEGEKKNPSSQVSSNLGEFGIFHIEVTKVAIQVPLGSSTVIWMKHTCKNKASAHGTYLWAQWLVTQASACSSSSSFFAWDCYADGSGMTTMRTHGIFTY